MRRKARAFFVGLSLPKLLQSFVWISASLTRAKQNVITNKREMLQFCRSHLYNRHPILAFSILDAVNRQEDFQRSPSSSPRKWRSGRLPQTPGSALLRFTRELLFRIIGNFLHVSKLWLG